MMDDIVNHFDGAAEYLRRAAGERMPEATIARRVERIRHEIKRREVQVARVEAPSANLRRVTLHGEALADFVSASFDDHVKLIFDAPAGADPARRDYTPRSYDNAARELVIEFALHGAGPAADWARAARAGMPLTVAGPKGSLVIPLDWDWHLFIADATGLPAIARRLEELPAGARAIAILNVADPAERRVFASQAELALQWVASDDEMLAAARALVLPAGEGYAWCAGEARAMAALRALLVHDKGHPAAALRAAAYWKRGAIAHHENLEG
jgi:NADPH-dependent ferric siderophore reductase